MRDEYEHVWSELAQLGLELAVARKRALERIEEEPERAADGLDPHDARPHQPLRRQMRSPFSPRHERARAGERRPAEVNVVRRPAKDVREPRPAIVVEGICERPAEAGLLLQLAEPAELLLGVLLSLVKKVDAMAAFQKPSDHWVEEPDVAEAPEQEHDPELPPAIHRPLRH